MTLAPILTRATARRCRSIRRAQATIEMLPVVRRCGTRAVAAALRPGSRRASGNPAAPGGVFTAMAKRTRGLVTLVALSAVLLLAGCGGSSSPSAAPLDLATVAEALRASDIPIVNVVDGLDTRDGAWKCLPGPFRLARVSQQAPAAIARPGDRPAVDVLLFATEAQRVAAQATIGLDGQVTAQGCAVMVDWVATPHVVGVGNVLLFIATDDAATVDQLQAAAAHLGGASGSPMPS